MKNLNDQVNEIIFPKNMVQKLGSLAFKYVDTYGLRKETVFKEIEKVLIKRRKEFIKKALDG